MKLFEGIRYKNDSFMFDFEKDGESEIINLTEEIKESSIYNNVFFYSYEFNDSCSSDIRTSFIHEFKFGNKIDKIVKHKFITKAIDKLDAVEDLDSFDCVVFPESKSFVVQDMLEYIMLGTDCEMSSYRLVKKLPKDIEFDYKKFERLRLNSGNYTEEQKKEVLKNIDNMMNDIHNCDYFSIARNSKYKYRKYIKNFYKFDNIEEKEAYECLAGNKILLIDDIATSGTTISLMLNTLKTIDAAEIVVFSLIGNTNI